MLRKEHRVEVPQPWWESQPFHTWAPETPAVLSSLSDVPLLSYKMCLLTATDWACNFLPPALPGFCAHCPFKAWHLCALADIFVSPLRLWHDLQIKIRMYFIQLQNLFIHLTVYHGHPCMWAGMSRMKNSFIFFDGWITYPCWKLSWSKRPVNTSLCTTMSISVG